jgi:hypothetical protein
VGLADEAARTARSIEGSWEWTQALAIVAGGLATAGQAEEAIKVAHSVEGHFERARALASVANRLAKAGQMREAMNAAHGIEDSKERARTLATIARSAAGDDNAGVIYDVVKEILLSSYARVHLATIPLPVVERLLAEQRLIHE